MPCFLMPKSSSIKLPHDPVTVENFPSAQKRMDPSLIHPFSSFIIFRKDSTFLKIHTDHTILSMSSSRSQNCNAHQNLPLSPKDRIITQLKALTTILRVLIGHFHAVPGTVLPDSHVSALRYILPVSRLLSSGLQYSGSQITLPFDYHFVTGEVPVF